MKHLATTCLVVLGIACGASILERRGDSDTGDITPHEHDQLDDRVVDEEARARLDQEIAQHEESLARRRSVFQANTEGAEVDSYGNIVVDLFCGFTPQAEAHVGGYLDMACELAADTITGTLKDSGISNVRVRSVGAEPFNASYDLDHRWNGCTAKDLAETKPLISAMAQKHGADIMTTFVYRNDSYVGQYNGMAYMPGRYSIVNIRSMDTVQHEVGHNFGLDHCPEDSDSKGNTGYRVPQLNYGTCMCGNFIPYFSNPNLRFNGYPLGNSVTSAVRYMQKSIGPVSKQAKAVYPLDERSRHRTIIRSEQITLLKKYEMTPSFTINITADMPTVWVSLNPGRVSEVIVGKGKPPTLWDYYARDKSSFIALKNAPPDTYYIALNARYDGAAGTTRTVIVSQPTADLEKTTTTTKVPTTTITPTKNPTTCPSRPTTTRTILTTTKPPMTSTTKVQTASTTTADTSIPEWSKTQIYNTPCNKVRHKGLVYYNGWYVAGTEPDTNQRYGPWRTADSPDRFSFCFKK